MDQDDFAPEKVRLRYDAAKADLWRATAEALRTLHTINCHGTRICRTFLAPRGICSDFGAPTSVRIGSRQGYQASKAPPA